MVVCGGMTTTGEYWGTGGREPAIMFTTNPTRTDMESNRGLHSGNNRQDWLMEDCEESHVAYWSSCQSHLAYFAHSAYSESLYSSVYYISQSCPTILSVWKDLDLANIQVYYTGRTGWQLKMCKWVWNNDIQTRNGMLPHSEFLLAILSSIPTIR
jgi:hypothetical protein